MDTVEIREIPWGDDGAVADLAIMREKILTATRDPTTVYAARDLAVMASPVRSNPDTLAQAMAIRAWLADVWRFVDDPKQNELLREPRRMLLEYSQKGYVTGDCDEAAILGAGLGVAIGMDAHLVAVDFGGPEGRYGHVYAYLTTAGVDVDLDVTKPAGPVPSPVRTLIMDV
jgi:hypothetical protein